MGFLVGMGASLLSSYLSQKAAKDAASQQAQAGREGLAHWQDLYDRQAADLNPFIQGGTDAYNKMSQLSGPSGALGRKFTMADFYQYPGYQFAVEQGQKALGNTNAA